MKNIFILAAILVIVVGLAVGLTRPNKISLVKPSTPELVEEIGQESYVDYSELALANASENGRAVLFFKANWCSTCSALDKELINETGELPEDVTVLKLNYDKEKELKKKYKVIIQHTLVQVDENGEELKKWVGGGVETIKQQLI